MENRIKFKHFSPNSSENNGYAHLLSLVDDLAPADSYVHAIVDKVQDGTFKTIIVVKSVCGKFTSESMDFSPFGSLKKAQKAILHSIAEWKKRRFDKED